MKREETMGKRGLGKGREKEEDREKGREGENRIRRD